MQTFYQLLGMVGAGLVIWFMYKTIKGRPEQFSRDKINQSFFTMGILGIVMIGFVGLLVFLVRHT